MLGIWVIFFIILKGSRVVYTSTLKKPIQLLLTKLISDDFAVTFNVYFAFIFPISLSFFVIWIVKPFRKVLVAFGTKIKGNNWKLFILGLLLGFSTNIFCIICAMFNNDISFTFWKFEPIQLIIMFIAVLIQSSTEEIVCRGFILQYTKKFYNNSMLICFINSLYFSLLHIFNPGISFICLLNIFLLGFIFSLFVYYLDSLWVPIAFHTAWNFSQGLLFGVPNSGKSYPYTMIKAQTSTENSFFWNVKFGVEGTYTCLIVGLIITAIIIFWGEKNKKVPTDVWKM